MEAITKKFPWLNWKGTNTVQHAMQRTFQQLPKLDEIVKIAVDPGNAHANDYLLGMANGLLLAQAIMHDTDVSYLEMPNKGPRLEISIKAPSARSPAHLDSIIKADFDSGTPAAISGTWRDDIIGDLNDKVIQLQYERANWERTEAMYRHEAKNLQKCIDELTEQRGKIGDRCSALKMQNEALHEAVVDAKLSFAAIRDIAERYITGKDHASITDETGD